jgi:TnpA family transposase
MGIPSRSICVTRHRIHLQRVIENRDNILRVAGLLKLGHLSASALMHSLQASKSTSALAKGIIKLGRIAKTLYLLSYIDDASYR